MKRVLAAAAFLLAFALPAAAQEYFDIDVDVPEYPEMLPVPDSPVYYAPNVDSNYFFYDGLYWDYNNDRWYASPWYNGPWSYVDPIYVPTYVLWVPIHYYHRPSHRWHGWNTARPPRWSEHWGRDWQARHNEAYRNNPRGGYARAPLPEYQRSYSRANYPRVPQQQSQLHSQHYGYRPQERTVQQHYERRGMGAAAPAASAPGASSPQRAPVDNPASRAAPAENPASRSVGREGGGGGRERR